MPIEPHSKIEVLEPAWPSSPDTIGNNSKPYATPEEVIPSEVPTEELHSTPPGVEHPPPFDSSTVTDSIFNGHYITIKIERAIPRA
ncbi:hypothetical protein OAG48_00020 [bacterium]|nr:hypothetical protein [bacterium]